MAPNQKGGECGTVASTRRPNCHERFSIKENRKPRKKDGVVVQRWRCTGCRGKGPDGRDAPCQVFSKKLNRLKIQTPYSKSKR